jgi:hypothetical protein
MSSQRFNPNFSSSNSSSSSSSSSGSSSTNNDASINVADNQNTSSKISTDICREEQKSSDNDNQTKDEFSYVTINTYLNEKLSKKEFALFQKDGYQTIIQGLNPAFIFFMPVESSNKFADENKACDEGTIFQILGLKFHISLPEDNKNILSQGFNIAKDILMKENIFFKVIRSHLNISDDIEQRGKIITIYAGNNPENDSKKWAKLLTILVEQLVSANIPPGYRVCGTTSKPEKILGNSHYITYRYHDENSLFDKTQKDLKSKFELKRKKAEDIMSKITGLTGGVQNGWPVNDFLENTNFIINNQPPIPHCDIGTKLVNITTSTK